MDGLVENCDWESSDAFEHDYSLSPIKECLIYYLVGYLSKQISTRSKCDICISVFKNMNSFSNVSEAELINFKSMGKLIHPKYVFYKFICKVEDYFTKNINSADVYSEMIEDILQNEDLNFTCDVHKDDILEYSIRGSILKGIESHFQSKIDRKYHRFRFLQKLLFLNVFDS